MLFFNGIIQYRIVEDVIIVVQLLNHVTTLRPHSCMPNFLTIPPPEFAQTHNIEIDNVIQSSHPLPLYLHALILTSESCKVGI